MTCNEPQAHPHRCGCARTAAPAGPLCFCGLTQTKNPHPDAGKPERILEVGAVYECIPCLTKSRHEWSQRALKAEKAARPDTLSFTYRHPISGKSHTVAVSSADVINNAPDMLYDKLGDEICNCQPLGETNVVECGCDDYIDSFELITPTNDNAGIIK